MARTVIRPGKCIAGSEAIRSCWIRGNPPYGGKDSSCGLEEMAGCIYLVRFCSEAVLGPEGAGRKQKVEVTSSKEGRKT